MSSRPRDGEPWGMPEHYIQFSGISSFALWCQPMWHRCQQIKALAWNTYLMKHREFWATEGITPLPGSCWWDVCCQLHGGCREPRQFLCLIFVCTWLRNGSPQKCKAQLSYIGVIKQTEPSVLMWALSELIRFLDFRI